MADSGAVERNAEYAARALERARLRNGGNGSIPASPSASVLGTDSIPSMAVNTPRRQTGPNGGE